MREWGTDSKTEQLGGTTATIAIASSLAKEVRSSSTADSNRICSNEESWENKCSNSMLKLADRVYTSIRPIYYGGGS